ncbi:MAG: glycosyltransferase [Anaerolineaceae bacterium]|nr:glycosyltransferase [Anaerolineaceae bacterium]
MKLLYIADIRLPTEKAHGLQIMQNCEAFAQTGADVTLWIPRRINTPELRAIRDVWRHYGTTRNFNLRRLFTLDLLPLVPGQGGKLAALAFYLQLGTFTLAAVLRALFTPADVYYSRDAAVILALSLVKPGRRLVYEAHRLNAGRAGRWMQRQVTRRAGTVVAVTKKLADGLVERGAKPERVLVAHDGIRRERFADLPSQAEARAALGWPGDAFIVGYVGRLQTLSMDKGVGTLIAALAQVAGASLGLVGGPDDMAEAFRAHWLALGLEVERFLNAGQVAPERVPLCLSALDVCAMPFPWTTHFAYYASPMKIFEYMASGRAIVASDLPSTAEVVTHGESALLTPPSDVAALAAAIMWLRDDPALRERLAAQALHTVMTHYTWESRAAAILAKVNEAR